MLEIKNLSVTVNDENGRADILKDINLGRFILVLRMPLLALMLSCLIVMPIKL